MLITKLKPTPTNSLLQSSERLFQASAYRAPAAIYSPAYILAILNPLERGEIAQILHDCKSKNVQHVHIFILPRALYGDYLGSTLDAPYGSDEFWNLLHTIVSECNALGMTCVIPDEPGWPSGMAGGTLLSDHRDRFLRSILTCEKKHLCPGECFNVPGCYEFAVCDRGGTRGTFKPNETTGPFKESAELLLYRIEGQEKGPIAPDNPYPDLLNPLVAQRFIKLAYRAYREKLKQFCDDTVSWIYQNEPTYGGIRHDPIESFRWTDKLEETFSKEKGYRLEPYLQDLMAPPAEGEALAVTRARVDYHDLLSTLFVRNYLDPIFRWCAENQMSCGGHFLMDHDPARFEEGGHGHLLRSMRHLHIPGVDTIYQETFPGKRSHHFAKYASSVARQLDRPFASTMPFGASGSSVTPHIIKWTIDHQFVRGLNLSTFSVYSASSDFTQQFHRPVLGPWAPLWRYQDQVNRYISRLSYALSRGNAICHTAVYFDMRSIWAGGDDQKSAIRLQNDICRNLLRAQCDFDFVDDDILADSNHFTPGGSVRIGPMQYDTLIVPETRWMVEEARKNIVRLTHEGGRIYVIRQSRQDDPSRNDWADQMEEAPNVRFFSDHAYVRELEPVVRLTSPEGSIRATKRATRDHRIYFLVNEEDRAVETTVIFSETSHPVACDPIHGRLYRLGAKRNDEGISLPMSFDPWESKLLLFGDVEAEEASLPRQISHARGFSLSHDRWQLRPILEIQLKDGHFLSYEHESVDWRQTALGDWRAVLGPHFSGEVEYRILFDGADRFTGVPITIDLGSVKYACEASLNGRSLGRKAWGPFIFQDEDGLRPTDNEIRVRVANTLSNAFANPIYPETVKKSNISTFYVEPMMNFEKETLPSGLFGPVRIIPQDT